MRIPARLRPKVAAAPRKGVFQSIHFLPCMRCMGHGHFETVPPEPETTVCFSQIGALTHLVHLSSINRLSANQYALLEKQILVSGLPDKVPPAIEVLVIEDLTWEGTLIKLAKAGEWKPAFVDVSGLDLAEVVHEFLLGSKEHPKLQLQ